MKALLVIDMLKDFIYVKGTLYCGDRVKSIIPIIKTKIDDAHKKDDLVIFLTDAHKKDDLEFRRFLPHCIKGSWGAEIIDELKVRRQDYIVPKTRCSGFYNTSLESILKKHKITEVDVVGVCTSISVMDTVGELRNRDIEVRVFKGAVTDFDREFHEYALKRMKRIYKAEIV